MTPTAHYIRFSGRRQIGGISLPDQIERLSRASSFANEQVVGVYIDQARSGANAQNRPEYQRLLNDARQGLFKRVRIDDVSRGHRNDFDRRAFEMELARCGVQVVYNGEPDKEAPHVRKLRRGMLGVASELQSDETSQTTYKRHLHRAARGMWRGGPWPYGLQPDGHGWFIPDPASYQYLLWILERRAEGLGYHAITKLLNEGIALDSNEPSVPPTPGMLAYQRRPYLERQDPTSGDIIRLERSLPSANWSKTTIRRIVENVVEGVYAGILVWGREYNRFAEDSDGNAKTSIRADTGRPLVPLDLLRRVQAVELATKDGTIKTVPKKGSYLLTLRCGICHECMHGYLSTKYKNGKKYTYRKYRCSGRANKAGACRMPMLNAELVENLVCDSVFYGELISLDAMVDELQVAIEQQRGRLQKALGIISNDLATWKEKRESALDAIADRRLTPLLQSAMESRAEEAVKKTAELEEQQRKVQLGIDTLAAYAQNVALVLHKPVQNSSRWQDPNLSFLIKQALHLLIKEIRAVQIAPRSYAIEVDIYTVKGLIFRGLVPGESTNVPELTNLYQSIIIPLPRLKAPV